MKKLVIVMLCLFTTASLKAQTESGNIFVGADLGFSNTKTEALNGNATFLYLRTSSINLRPQFGYFIADNFALGTSVDFQSTREEDIDGNLTLSNQTQLLPFARYYFPMTEQFSIYGQGSIGVGFSKSEIIVNDATILEQDGFILSVGLSAGLAFFPTEKINVNLGFRVLNFESTNVTSPDNNAKTIINDFNFGVDTFSPFLSLNYFF